MKNQGSLGGNGRQTPSQGKRAKGMEEKGCYVEPLPKRPTVWSEALSRRPEECTGLLYQLPMRSTTTREEYKGYNKVLQENVFNELIMKINVTFMEPSRQAVALERIHRLKELGMKQESLIY